jgi:histidine triad (HIT) family protein
LAFDENCIFCKIVAKQAPVSILYEDDTVLAFMDIRPLSAGHALVIPKAHYVDIFDIPSKDLAAVIVVSKAVAAAVKKATGADGISIIEQNGKAAGQDVFHLHVHVVPRFAGVKLPAFSDLKVAERSELDALAEKIRRLI